MTTLSRWILTLLRVFFLAGSHSRWSRRKKTSSGSVQALPIFHCWTACSGNQRLSVPGLDSDPREQKKINLSPGKLSQTEPPKIQRDFGRHSFPIWRWAGGFALFLHFSLVLHRTENPTETRHAHTTTAQFLLFRSPMCTTHNTAAAAGWSLDSTFSRLREEKFSFTRTFLDANPRWENALFSSIDSTKRSN